MSNPNDQVFNDQLENLKAHLLLAKTMNEAKQQEQFCVLLEKAQQILGDLNPHIAVFYYDYGSFLLGKLEKSMDLFNTEAVPNAQQDDFIDQYDEFYDEDSIDAQNGANNKEGQKKQAVNKQEEKKQIIKQASAQNTQKQANQNAHSVQTPAKVVYEDDNVQITEVDDKMKEKMAENPLFEAPNDQEQQLTDIEICYENFQAAMNIYSRQLCKIQNGQHSPLQKQEIIKYQFHIHGRMGELYLLDQKYNQAIDEFRIVVKMASDFDHPQTRRVCSEAHFNIGNALLHQNNSGCEQLAIEQYVDAIVNLLKFLSDTEHYDISAFQIPSLQKSKVDRYQYLPAPFDNQIVADLKEVISVMLDKIEDTYEQIGVRSAYEAEKQKMNQYKRQLGFKEVPKDVKVTNLGTFGNRKRAPAQVQQKNPNIPSALKGMNPFAPNKDSSEKQQSVINPESETKEKAQPKAQLETQLGNKIQHETKDSSKPNKVQNVDQKPTEN